MMGDSTEASPGGRTTRAGLTVHDSGAEDRAQPERTIQDRAWQALRHALIVGKLPPGKPAFSTA